MQRDNEIWSINRTSQEKYAKNEVVKLVPDRFLFFKKALHHVKASGVQLDFIIF